MPFTLSPRLASLASRLNNASRIEKERFHKDEIMISNESPECLDEVFWIKADKDYFNKSLNTNLLINEKYLNGYGYLISSFCKFQNKGRSLIKNNNNHIRLRILSRYFSQSIFLIIYRDPIFQSLSLLRMHKRFSELQANDSYILDYMNLLGHREFGKGAKSFQYGNTAAFFVCSIKA